jgi:hypothetical protein
MEQAWRSNLSSSMVSSSHMIYHRVLWHVSTSETKIGSWVAPGGRARLITHDVTSTDLRTHQSTCTRVVSAGILASEAACAKPRPGDRLESIKMCRRITRNQLTRRVRDEHACRSGGFHLLHVGYTGKDVSFLVSVKPFHVYVAYESRQWLEIAYRLILPFLVLINVLVWLAAFNMYRSYLWHWCHVRVGAAMQNNWCDITSLRLGG